MSKADEMFNELGYRMDIGKEYGLIRYNKDEHRFIRFMIANKEIEVNKIEPNGDLWILDINMKLLQAINEKCKELGWLLENSIPKQVIEEKIEELKNKQIGTSTGIYAIQVDILEEILEGK